MSIIINGPSEMAAQRFSIGVKETVPFSTSNLTVTTSPLMDIV